MPSPTRDEYPIKIKFGGGMNTRASEDDIQAVEAADGKNFRLDLRNRNLRPREYFDLAGTAANNSQINGFAQLKETDGTLTTLVQAGTTVYETDFTSWVSKGTVTSGAKLRGPLSQNYLLNDVAIITDLADKEPVLQWDGTTLSTLSHNLGGDFYARYAFAHNDRMWYARVISGGTSTPHLIAASKVEDYDNLSVTNKPASAAAADDPFYFTVPDLRPINGMVEAFDRMAVSTGAGNRGNIYQITGLTASASGDYKIQPLYPNSGAQGDEPFAYIGNDIAYGRQGVIESLQRTDRFGDVETDDLSVPVADRIKNVTGWTSIYNQRLKRGYFFPDSTSEIWVLFKALLDEGRVSPWVRWTTDNAATFIPTAVMSMLDPSDGLEYTFFGDDSGKVYRLEGSSAGDAGSTDVPMEWLSGLISAPPELLSAEVHTIEGYIQYRKSEAATVTLTFEYSGRTAYNESITISIPAISGRPTYGGTSYYGGTDYYNVPFNQKLIRQIFGQPGQGNQFQVRVAISGTTDFEINEIGLRLEASTP